jgi:hypothetical protein
MREEREIGDKDEMREVELFTVAFHGFLLVFLFPLHFVFFFINHPSHGRCPFCLGVPERSQNWIFKLLGSNNFPTMFHFWLLISTQARVLSF